MKKGFLQLTPASLENVKCSACLKAKKGERNKKPCSGEEIFTSKHLKGQLEPPASDEKCVFVTKMITFTSCVTIRDSRRSFGTPL